MAVPAMAHGLAAKHDLGRIGDLQRIVEYPACGFTVPQEIPPEVVAAYERRTSAGFVSRAIASSG
jgi:hypothetical protein